MRTHRNRRPTTSLEVNSALLDFDDARFDSADDRVDVGVDSHFSVHVREVGLHGAALDCQEAVFSAQTLRGAPRQAALARADAALSALRLYLRLAHRWHWLNDGQYAHVSTLVAEVGRLLGGWVRQSSS